MRAEPGEVPAAPVSSSAGGLLLTPFAMRAYWLKASRQAAARDAAGVTQSGLATKADEQGHN